MAGGIPDEKVILKPNFVDDPGPRANRPESEQVLFVGRLSPEKGILELLEAWRRASPRDLRLLVIGDGPLMSDARAHLDGSIRLLGRLPKGEVRQLMLCSRALVLPSRAYEVQPLVLLEALAAGLPRARLGPRREPGSARCPGGRMARGTGSRRGLEPRPLTGSRAARSSTRRERGRAPHTASGLRPKSAFGIWSAPTRVHLTHEPPSVTTPAVQTAALVLHVDSVTAEVVTAMREVGIRPPLLKGPRSQRGYTATAPLAATPTPTSWWHQGPIDAQGQVLRELGFQPVGVLVASRFPNVAPAAPTAATWIFTAR